MYSSDQMARGGDALRSSQQATRAVAEEEKKYGCDEYQAHGLYDLNQEKVGGCHKDY